MSAPPKKDKKAELYCVSPYMKFYRCYSSSNANGFVTEQKLIWAWSVSKRKRLTKCLQGGINLCARFIAYISWQEYRRRLKFCILTKLIKTSCVLVIKSTVDLKSNVRTSIGAKVVVDESFQIAQPVGPMRPDWVGSELNHPLQRLLRATRWTSVRSLIFSKK